MVFAGLLPLLRRKAVLLEARLPPREWWLRGHIWLGLLSVVFIGFHSGLRLQGTLVAVLTVVYLVVVVSGVLGLLVQSVLPHRLTVASRHEIPPGQIGAVCAAWRAECDALVDELCGPRPAFASEPAPSPDPMRRFYEAEVRPGLWETPSRWPLGSDDRIREAFDRMRKQGEFAAGSRADAVLKRLETVCRERLDLLRQQGRTFWLHAWLPVHVGLSAALLVLGIAHVVTALWY